MHALASSTKWSKLSSRTLILFCVIVLDAVSTVYLVGSGMEELNPFMAWVIEKLGLVEMALAKIACSLVVLILAHELRVLTYQQMTLVTVMYIFLYVAVPVIVEVIRVIQI